MFRKRGKGNQRLMEKKKKKSGESDTMEGGRRAKARKERLQQQPVKTLCRKHHDVTFNEKRNGG